MPRFPFVFGCLVTALGFFWLVAVVAGLLFVTGGVPVMPLLFLLGVVYCLVLFAYFHYRLGRQAELLHLLTTAVEARAPLAPVLRAYLVDRPNGPLREFWVATLLFFILPGYYWVWYQRFNFNRKVARVAALLEAGYPLPDALEATPGVAPRQTMLAAAVGESVGRLDLCLRGSAVPRTTPVWLEVLPRVVYPLLVLFFINGVLSFWTIFLAPKMYTIFRDFNMQLPAVTLHLMAWGSWLSEYGWLVALASLFLAWVAVLLIFSPGLRWHFPIISWFYRRGVQSRVLKMLSPMLEAGKPVPKALSLLESTGFFPGVVERRLSAACERVERGEPLADSLARESLLPWAVAPLVRAAERVHNLPWVLAELGDSLTHGMIRRLRRASVIIGPLILAAVGGLVGCMALGMFLPLIKLIEGMSR